MSNLNVTFANVKGAKVRGTVDKGTARALSFTMEGSAFTLEELAQLAEQQDGMVKVRGAKLAERGTEWKNSGQVNGQDLASLLRGASAPGEPNESKKGKGKRNKKEDIAPPSPVDAAAPA